ncbi:TfoX/Sxy family protein [Solitalea canadensis]|uniref:TfoX N-terminal domain-containing protein n=1 Tax=Solitalea canadensis (strain ATCC 29591 / DSM 3403 / JCM 21819 / LMG 8368 / NBRC 15130 / NCIMB 12057 / USAM 9D) TaxID=929556 RepID=H8KQI9_SOLCM|nr:TfoX/Sxy family protein [Solitalea canadensis]AFD06727.1 hypothetical protein Solca_1661 [Solitalea canadensis DSM 3403]
MSYDEQLAQRIRESLAELPDVAEKTMFKGLTFMVNDKMCISVRNDDIMCRLNPDLQEEVLSRNGTSEMIHNGRSMKGFIYVNKTVLKTKADLDYWINLSLEYNTVAKSAKKKK